MPCSSGGQSGQVFVAGVPSMRHIATIPVFAPYPGTGYGFDEESRKQLGRFTWGVVLPGARDDVLGGSNTLAGFFGTLNVTAYMLGTTYLQTAVNGDDPTIARVVRGLGARGGGGAGLPKRSSGVEPADTSSKSVVRGAPLDWPSALARSDRASAWALA